MFWNTRSTRCCGVVGCFFGELKSADDQKAWDDGSVCKLEVGVWGHTTCLGLLLLAVCVCVCGCLPCNACCVGAVKAAPAAQEAKAKDHVARLPPAKEASHLGTRMGRGGCSVEDSVTSAETSQSMERWASCLLARLRVGAIACLLLRRPSRLTVAANAHESRAGEVVLYPRWRLQLDPWLFVQRK